MVLDLCLTGASGEDLWRQIRQKSKGIPIVVSSDSRGVTEVILLLGLGADDYMKKTYQCTRVPGPRLSLPALFEIVLTIRWYRGRYALSGVRTAK